MYLYLKSYKYYTKKFKAINGSKQLVSNLIKI